VARDRPWRFIAAELRRAIEAGEYGAGDRLPTGAELMQQYGVARQTVQNAIEQLRSEGLITSTPGGRVQVRVRQPIQRLARNRLSRKERAKGRGTFLTDAASGSWRPEVDVTLRVQAAEADVAQELRSMMESVVDVKGATGTQAAVQGFRVAGKTGTGKMLTDGQYTKHNAGSFIGMAPADNPRYVIGVFADVPDGTGGDVAAPAFSNMMAFTLLHYRVPPSGTKPPKFKLFG